VARGHEASTRWLNRDDLAALLICSSHEDIGFATGALLSGMRDLRSLQIENEELDSKDLELATAADAGSALARLVEHFGLDRIRELIGQFEFPDNAA
jgi:hypothetical protein